MLTGVVLIEAGNTYPPSTGFGLHYNLAPHRQVLFRSELANPIGFNPTLQNYGLTFTKTFLPSPVLFNTAPFRHAGIGPLTSFQTTPRLHPAPIRYGAIEPNTITHISPPVRLRAPTKSFPTSSFLSQGLVFNSGLLRPAPIPPPPSAVFRPSPTINHAVIGTGFQSNQQGLSPSSHNYKFTNEALVTQKVPEKSVSYSITENDYQYLHRHKVEGKDSPYNPIPGFNTASLDEQHQHPNYHSHNDKPIRDESSHKVSDSVPVFKRSLAPSEAYQGFAEPSFANVPEPVAVFKDIYFHVPPPEFEEPPPALINVPPPKKTYNIVFIKAPAQEQQNSVYLQQIQNRQPQIEDKTLIYVLSKKEDSVQVIPSTLSHKPSRPEVYFVKYQTKFGDITDFRNDIAAEHFPENISVHSQEQGVEDNHVVPR